MPSLCRPARPSTRILLLITISAVLALAPVGLGRSEALTVPSAPASAPDVVHPSVSSYPELTSITAATSSRCSSGPGSPPSGWRRIMGDGFREDIPLGEWGKPGGRWEHPGGKWRARPAGAKDTSGRGTYNSMKTTSQHHGLLDVWLHSEGSTRYVAAPIPLVGDKRAFRISLCMRADEIPGYKIAFMLWPRDGSGNSRGEIDFPEGKLLYDRHMNAFMHYDPKPASGKKQDWYSARTHLRSWHVFRMVWVPARHVVAFYVDGRLIGKSVKPEVPNGPMHYIMQMETWVGGTLPAPASGHVRVDWFTMDVRR